MLIDAFEMLPCRYQMPLALFAPLRNLLSKKLENNRKAIKESSPPTPKKGTVHATV